MKSLFFFAVAFAAISCLEQVTFAQTHNGQAQRSTSRRQRAAQVMPFNSAARELSMRSRELQSTGQANQEETRRAPRVTTLPFRPSAQQQQQPTQTQPTPGAFKPMERQQVQQQPIAKLPVAKQPVARQPIVQQSVVERPIVQQPRRRVVETLPKPASQATVSAQPQAPIVRQVPTNAPTQTSATMPMSMEDQISSSVSVVGTDIIAPPGINVGQESQLTAVANNLGDQDLAQVVMRLQLPPHLKFVQATPAPVAQQDNLLEFRIANLPASSKREIVLTVIPQEKLPIRIVAETHTVNQDQIEIAVQKPEIQVEAQATAQAIVGDTIHHVIRVTNTGDGIADNLQLKMALPRDMVAIADQESQFVGDLGPGMTRELIYETRSTASGIAEVEYMVSGQNILAKDRTEIAVVWPELHVELLGPKMNLVNRPGDYTIRLSNPCDITINATKVSLEIPAGLEVTTLSREGKFNSQLRTIEWDLASMAPGAEETIQFRGHLLHNSAQTCQVTVESVETQANQLALETKPYSHTALKVAMRNKTGAIVVGDTAEFEIIASNEGAVDADNVVLEVEIPTWMEPVPSNNYQIDRAKSVIRFSPQQIAMASQKELTFEATCNKAGNYVLRSMLQHESQSRPLISDASLFILDGQQEKIGAVVSPEKVLR